MILFINCCVRSDSRTKRLADAFLGLLDGEVEELRLEDVDFPLTDEKYLVRRDALIAQEKFDDPLFAMARQFAEADKIVIAAPYWDLSFPASLKQYIEHINVLGITFLYTPQGTPEGLCKATDLYYITTAGGAFCPEEFGYGYIKTLAENFYGIKNTRMISAQGLDIYGADPEKIIDEAIQKLEL
ncbi:MAG: NAD(P)H-dependent oxidoreductase [Clostridiales bacterium]|nr:NAD(P)H-dependent oxidoreductase [Clostridiales bacterium]